MIPILAELIKNPHKLDCIKHPIILQLESFKFSPFHAFSLAIFIFAIIHTLSVNKVRKWAQNLELHQAPKRIGKRHEKSPMVQVLYFLSEVEIIFAFWVIPLLIVITSFYGWHIAAEYMNTRDYTEPLFVTTILSLTATRPILYIAGAAIQRCANLLGGSLSAWWFVLLTIGPILGSLITEAGAMTLCALLLSQKFYAFKPSTKLAYATLALLFVHISVGGILTNFASPAVLVLAHCWHWTTGDMFFIFGWKAVVGIILSNLLYWWFFRKEFSILNEKQKRLAASQFLSPIKEREEKIPIWLFIVHVLFIVWIVCISEYTAIFIASFLFFIGFHQATRRHQYPIRLVRPMLVGLFLAGLVIHGGLQGWWVIDLLYGLSPLSVMGITIALTGFNDNTAISYLSSLIPGWGDAFKYAVFTGVIAGGGLTIIANAPNPAGYAILQNHFQGGIRPLQLFFMALTPTIIMYAIFFFFGPLFAHPT